MRKTDWRFRLWCFFAIRILKVPYTVNFTPPDSDQIVGIGFAWSAEVAARMQANYATPPQRPNRAQRRALNNAARVAAKETSDV